MARALGLRNRDSGRRGWGVSEKKERNREVKKEKKKKEKKNIEANQRYGEDRKNLLLGDNSSVM